jgi:threonine/homoserine/homoserine lactone efflux protein
VAGAGAVIWTEAATFAAAVFFLIATPGPGVLSTAGVGSAFGARAGIGYLTGLCIGNSAVALAVITGVAAIVLADPRLRVVLFVASMAYLAYLAVRIATAGARVAFIEMRRPPGFWDGLALQAINPKAYAVNTTFFAGFAVWPGAPVGEAVVKLLIINAIWIPLHVAWLWAGVSLRRLDLAPQVQRRVNVAMAASLLAVIGLAIWSLV